jgi:hypothetical protein
MRAVRQWLLIVVVVIQGLCNFNYAQCPVGKAYSNYNNLPFAEILDSISVRFQVYFSYNADLDFKNKHKTLNTYDNLSETLNKLTEGENLEFRIIGKQVIIVKFDSIHSSTRINEKHAAESRVISGRVIDCATKEPLPFTSISKNGGSFGTVANSKGEFVLKLNSNERYDSLVFSCIGYKSEVLEIASLHDTITVVKLKIVTIPIKQVIVKVVTGVDIVKEVLHNLKNNYLDQNAVQTAFYRETIRENDQYITVCEAVVDLSIVPYTSSFSKDQAHLFKGRKLINFNLTRKLQFKLEGGIYNCLQLDVVKDRVSFLSPEFFDKYTYKYLRQEVYNNRNLMVVEFDQKPEYPDYALYKGIMYIDQQSKALVAAKFGLSSQGMKFASEMLVRKEPSKYQIKPISTSYMVLYSYNNGRWYLNYLRTELKIKAKSEKFFHQSIYNSVSEMVITDTDTTEYRRFKRKEIAKSNDIVLDIINDYDEAFWGKYNIIQPELPMIESMKKLNIKQPQKQEQGFFDKLF